MGMLHIERSAQRKRGAREPNGTNPQNREVSLCLSWTKTRRSNSSTAFLNTSWPALSATPIIPYQLVAGFPGCQVCLKAAAKLDFQPLSPDRVESSFLEGWNGW
jgi:hypothetical protein